MARRIRKRKVALVLVVAVAAGFVVWPRLELLKDEKEFVRVSEGKALPMLLRVDDRDKTGADVVRAYLKGAVACSEEGVALMRSLGSGRSAEQAQGVFGPACEKGKGWRTELAAERHPKETDGQGRTYWRLEPAGDGLPKPVVVRVASERRRWRVQAVCQDACGSPESLRPD